MVFLQELSATNKALVHEIGDLEKEKAITYLMMMKLTRGKATRVVDCIGGQMVYLQSFLELGE